jgi:hypothetical protein
MQPNRENPSQQLRGPHAFVVAVFSNESTKPILASYQTRREAMRFANGVRATLAPQQGGRISVYDPSGTELQTWVEWPEGGRFTCPGGFLNSHP